VEGDNRIMADVPKPFFLRKNPFATNFIFESFTLLFLKMMRLQGDLCGVEGEIIGNCLRGD
jgi:hypothetical protein